MFSLLEEYWFKEIFLPQTQSITSKPREYTQASFRFPKNPAIVFVADLSKKIPVENYLALPTVTLSDCDEKQLAIAREYLLAQPNAYDGQQLIITQLEYNSLLNTLYIEAKRVAYSFIFFMNTPYFPKTPELAMQRLYKTGVLAPFITREDFYTALCERARDSFYSVAAGFLEPIDNQLNLTPKNLIHLMAEQEVLEEFLANSHLENGSFEIPSITSVSVRKHRYGLGTIEFIAPCWLQGSVTDLEYILQHNNAVDRLEHNTNYLLLNLQMTQRGLAKRLVSNGQRLAGSFLYDPIVLDLMYLTQTMEKNHALFNTLPNSQTQVIAL